MDQPRAHLLVRLQATPDEVIGLAGPTPTALLHRSRDAQWTPIEIICHLRDMEELALGRYRQMLQMQEPMLPSPLAPPDPERWGLIEEGASLVDPDRWAEERQYRRQDASVAVAAFTRWRLQTLDFLGLLTEVQWSRMGVHPALGTCTITQWAALSAYHDVLHLAQLTAATSPVHGRSASSSTTDPPTEGRGNGRAAQP